MNLVSWGDTDYVVHDVHFIPVLAFVIIVRPRSTKASLPGDEVLRVCGMAPVSGDPSECLQRH